MDPDKYEEIMNCAIDNPYPEQVAKAFKASFPNRFMYNRDEEDELKIYIDQHFIPLILQRLNNKKLLTKLKTNYFKHQLICELTMCYTIDQLYVGPF